MYKPTERQFLKLRNTAIEKGITADHLRSIDHIANKAMATRDYIGTHWNAYIVNGSRIQCLTNMNNAVYMLKMYIRGWKNKNPSLAQRLIKKTEVRHVK